MLTPQTFVVCLTPLNADVVGVTPLNPSTGMNSHADTGSQNLETNSNAAIALP